MKSRFFTYLVLSVLVLILSIFNIGIKSFTTSLYLQFITPSVVAGQDIYNNYANFALALERSAKLDDLEQQVVNLSEKILDYESLKDENKLLKSTLNIKDLTFQKEHLVIGKLVFIDKANAKATVLIPTQLSVKIKVGSAVVVSDSIIGVVSENNNTNVSVDLITNKNFVTEAINVNTNANGVVKGEFLGMTFSDVLNSEKLNLDDIVVTSAIGGKFGKRYVLGKVVEVKSTEGEPFQTAKVVSLVDLDKLTKVLIVVSQ